MNLIFLSVGLILSTFFSLALCQDEIPPDKYGFYFTHQPERLTPEVIQIFNNVVNEYIDYYDYSNKTIVYPQPKCPQPKCPETIIMDTPCDISSTEPESLGFFITLLLLSLLNLGILGFLIKQSHIILKTKLNPFKVRSDPLTA